MTPFGWLVGTLATLFALGIWAFKKYYMPSTDHSITEVEIKTGVEKEAEKILGPTKEELLVRMIDGTQEFEGYYPSTPAWKNNNPGSPLAGNIKKTDGTFYKFKTLEEGREFLKQYILRVARGGHEAYNARARELRLADGGDLNLMQYYHVYTGDPEPSPTNYGIAVGKRMGVDPFIWRLKELL